MERFERVPAPIAVGTDFVHGNELNLFERRMAPLQFTEPYFLQKGHTEKRVMKSPLRFSEHMTEIRSDEMTSYGKRRQKDTRRMKHEFADKIKEVIDRQKREEEEARKSKKDLRARWWHRQRQPDQRDPLKYLRYTNLKLVPESLLMSKDVVVLQLTGARLGDGAMTWIGGFIQQSYTVKRLILQGNYITENGVEHLVNGLRSTKSLLELDISLNPIGDGGVELISNALLENSKYSRLYSLNVSTCELTSASGFHLARLIHDFKPFQCLLAWRNRLGAAEDAPISGAGLILDELRQSSNMKLVNLTANDITDKEASDHASALERATRKKVLAGVERTQRQQRMENLLKEAAERKRRLGTARNVEEKIAIARLERQAEQEKSKLDMSRKLEERQRSYAEKQEREYQVRISIQTGGCDLVTEKPPCRLILEANSVQPSTLLRLSRYYSVTAQPDVDAWVARPRRFDNVIVPRRQVGDVYFARDTEDIDEHNIMPWDYYDPQVNHERRVALTVWREEERIKEELLVPVRFEKFAMTDVRHLSPEERARASSGFGVTAGVNSRIKLVRDPEKAKEMHAEEARAETERIAKIRSSYGLKADGTPAAAMSRSPSYFAKRTKDASLIHLGGGDGSVVEGEGSIVIGVDATASGSATAAHEQQHLSGDAAGATGPSFPANSSGAAGPVDENGEIEVTEAELMQRKMDERMRELRSHVEHKHPTFAEGTSEPSGDHDRDLKRQASAALLAVAHDTVDDALRAVLEGVSRVEQQWLLIRDLGEIGSPSDEDLRRAEEAKKDLVRQKLALTEALAKFPPVEQSAINLADGDEATVLLENFLDTLVKETDAPAGNAALVNAMVDHLPLAYRRILAERGLVAIAASDSSESYFTKFLSIPQHEFDVTEVCTACFYNQSSRIPMSFIFLQFVDLQPYESEIGDMMREFFADVASDRRAIPRENRLLKITLLRSIAAMSWLHLDFELPGSDGQSIFTRALYEGDTDVVDLLLEDPPKISDINRQLPDGTTALMQAVLGNSVPLVTRLLQQFPAIDVSIRSENGNALDLAVGLSRDPRIVALLRQHGAQPSGAKVDKSKVTPKKIRVKAKPEGAEGSVSPKPPTTPLPDGSGGSSSRPTSQ